MRGSAKLFIDVDGVVTFASELAAALARGWLGEVWVVTSRTVPRRVLDILELAGVRHDVLRCGLSPEQKAELALEVGADVVVDDQPHPSLEVPVFSPVGTALEAFRDRERNRPRRVLCHLSGGCDSAAAAAVLVDDGCEVETIFYDYGQVYAEQEMAASLRVSQILGLPPPLKYTIPGVGRGEGDYFHLRNLVLTAHSASLAAARGFDAVAVGSKSARPRPDDPWSYRDSTAQFYEALEAALRMGAEPSAAPVRVLMPLLGATKRNVISILERRGVQASDCWYCYESGDQPCGRCHHCLEVAEAIDGLLSNRAKEV